MKTPEGPAFLPAPPLHPEDVEAVFADTLRRIARQLRRLVPDRDDEPQDRQSQRQPALAALHRNAMLDHLSSGKGADKTRWATQARDRCESSLDSATPVAQHRPWPSCPATAGAGGGEGKAVDAAGWGFGCTAHLAWGELSSSGNLASCAASSAAGRP